MSKRREHKVMQPTEGAQQKPGTLRQAKANQKHVAEKLVGHPGHVSPKHKHHDEPGSSRPEFIDDIEVP